MVSIYVAPVTSSLTIWLLLTIATVGANITSIVDGSGGALHIPSINWGLCKHAITPRKPGGGVTCWMTANSLVGKGGLLLGGHHTQFLGLSDLNQSFP